MGQHRPGEYLSGRGRRALAALGISVETLVDVVRETFTIESRWGDNELRSQDSVFKPDGHAWMIVRPAFDRALADHARRQGIDIQTGMAVRGLVRQGRRWRVIATSGQRKIHFQAEIVIDASGRQSTLIRRLDAHLAYYDRLIGLTAICEARDCNRALLIESVQDGWWYSAILPNDRLVLTYMTDADIVRAAGGPREAWRRALSMAQGTRERWTGCMLPKRVHVRPAMTKVLDRVAGPGWLAIGDAAFSRDPLSSEGISIALEDGFDSGQHSVALAKGVTPSTDHNRRVVEYLRSRADVYKCEGRWVESLFWQRRHRPVWATTTIDIAPESYLIAPHSRRLRKLKCYCPGIDLAALMVAFGKGATAGTVAAAYREIAASRFSDHELLAGLQFLQRSQRENDNQFEDWGDSSCRVC